MASGPWTPASGYNQIEKKRGKRGREATVSTHPKYPQDVHQILTKYASVSKEWSCFFGLDRRNAKIEGRPSLSKTSIFKHLAASEQIRVTYYNSSKYVVTLPRDHFLDSLRESNPRAIISISHASASSSSCIDRDTPPSARYRGRDYSNRYTFLQGCTNLPNTLD